MTKDDILIIFPEGYYANNDAYEAVLTYLTKKQYLSGYGISLPITKDNCIYDYYRAHNTSKYQNARYIWHFYISFKERQKDKLKILSVANNVASIFANNYQVIYALDTDTDNDHVHFAVNAFSYHPEYEPLSEMMMTSYLDQIQFLLKNVYPCYIISTRRK